MLNEIILVLFYIVILLYSIIIHEVAHGLMALWLGDSTAKYAGRLNLNPIKHIDLWGSIIVPFMMFISTGFAFGWAKPVPYNPYNLRDQKRGPAMVALAGPLSNIFLALSAALMARFIALPAQLKIDIVRSVLGGKWEQLSIIISGSFSSILYVLLAVVIFWNTVLAFFNLIPMPPLDGSKLLFAVLPLRTETMLFLEQYGFFLLILFIILLAGPLGSFLNLMLNLFFGLAV